MIIMWTCVELGFSYRVMFAVKVNGEMKTRTREGYHPRQFLLDVLFIAHCFFGWIRVYSKSLLKSFFTWEIFLSSLKGKGEKVSLSSQILGWVDWQLRHNSWSRVLKYFWFELFTLQNDIFVAQCFRHQQNFNFLLTSLKLHPRHSQFLRNPCH